MDGGLDAALHPQSALDEIGHIVGGVDVGVSVHLHVEGGHDPPGAVVVDHQIVDADGTLILKLLDHSFNLGHGLLRGLLSQDGVLGIVQDLNTRPEDEQGHQNAHVGVGVKARELVDEGGDQHREGGSRVGQGIGGGSPHDRGVDPPRDLAVEDAQPELDQHRHAEDHDRHPAEHRLGGVEHLVHRPRQQLPADEEDEEGDDHGGHVLDAGVPKGVVAVGGLGGYLEGDEGDDLAPCVGEVVHRIGLHRDGTEEEAHREFPRGQQEIQNDAHRGGESPVGAADGGGGSVAGGFDEELDEEVCHGGAFRGLCSFGFQFGGFFAVGFGEVVLTEGVVGF